MSWDATTAVGGAVADLVREDSEEGGAWDSFEVFGADGFEQACNTVSAAAGKRSVILFIPED